MSTFRNPVGPQPSKVYWRRRLIVGIGLLAVILVIILIVVQPGRGDPTPASTTSPPASEETADGEETDAPAPPAGEAGSCDPSQVTVTAITDAAEYQPGVTPMLSFSVTNTSGAACTYDVGSDRQVYVITSGEDEIWNSTHCQTEPVPANQSLEPNKPVSSPPIGWDRTRSAPDTCDIERTAAIGEGATYRLTVSVGDSVSEPATFLLY